MIKRSVLYFLAAVLLAINLGGGVPASALPPDFGGKEILRLYADNRFVCTGFFIEPPLEEPPAGDVFFSGGSSWLVTAGHCVGNGMLTAKVTEHFEIALTVYAKVLLSPFHGKKAIDLAILTIPSGYIGKIKELDLADEDAKPGDSVYFHGFPRGIEAIGNYGIVEPIPGDKMLNGKMIHIYGSKVNGGASGSPVLNPEGEVVGIVWGMSNFTDKIAYITPVSYIKKMLEFLDLRDAAAYPDPYF